MRLISVNPNSASPKLGFLPRDWRLAGCSRHTPMQNYLLAALPAADYERLLPALELVPLRLGWAIYEAGGRLGYVYFPTNGIASLLHVLENGASAATAITGNEGCIGIASILGGDSTPIRTIVQSAGFAYRLKAEVVKREFERCGPLQRLLLHYTQALLTQIAQTAACNRHHVLEQQLCRLLLLCLDRLSSSELTMTQELIAYMLGVRREGVTAAASKLQKDGLIDYRRGHITVIDRPKLETRVCECYAVVKRELDRLLPATPQIAAASAICERRALSTVN
jgi:CRP-like cAMP-binding protein